MIKLLNSDKIYVKVENEIEKFLTLLIIEKFDLVEMKIIRNVYSKKDGKFLDRIEAFAKIRIEKVSFEKSRIVGKIEEVSSERLDKGHHGENIDIGKELVITKKSGVNESIKLILEKIRNFEIGKMNEIKEIVSKASSRFITDKNKIEEYLEYGIIERLYVCKENFFEFLQKIIKALNQNAKIVLLSEKEFCEKMKIAALLRFEI
ncbi:MAG: hypothetical protein QXL82_00040 [Candidatus Aenigmatarchaeota archaeon]